LSHILGHERTFFIIVETAVRRVIRKGVKLAAEWLGVAKNASISTQMLAFTLNADTPIFTFFLLGETHFKRRKTGIHMTAASTLGTIVKQHH